MSQTALVTGASSGIGRELARIHAEHGGDVIVVARREEKLAELQRELEQEHGVRVLVIARDLTRPEAPRAVVDQVTAAGMTVDYLINNAGFGGRGPFHERPWEEDLTMIQLNVVALTGLCRHYLPGFVERGSGRILNVSSIASLLPGPLQAVYFATKVFVTSFSHAIAEELRGTGVTVTALLPGATETEFAEHASMEGTAAFKETASAREVARHGYDAMLAGKLRVIAGVSPGQRLMLAAIPFAPTSVLLKQVRRMQEQKGGPS